MKMPENLDPIDYEGILKTCGGRLSIFDARILYNTAIEIKAQNIVEIGSMDGCSSMVFGYVCQKTGGHLYCLEPNPKTRWKGNMDRLGLADYATSLMKASPWVIPTDVKLPIDYLLIDGDHRVRWTLVDYHYWEPYVRPGGLIAFHDWTGANGVWEWVQRAVGIILETDELQEVTRNASTDRGIIVFRKPMEILNAKGNVVSSFSRRMQ